MITIEQQQVALESVLGGITGVTKVFVDMPDAVQRRDLPCLILAPRSAAYDRDRGGAYSLAIVRSWALILLAAHAETGREAQAEQAVKPFLARVPAALAEHPRLTTDDARSFTIELHGGRDEGAARVDYAGQSYAGTTFTFTTTIEDEVYE